MDSTSEDVAASEGALRALERQRISRELHDSTSQLLVALQLQLGRLRRQGLSGAKRLLDEMDEVLREIRASIKQISVPSTGDDEHERAKVQAASVFYSIGTPDRSNR